MKYAFDIRIERPRDEVVALFEDPDKLALWQGGLVAREPLDGESGQPGARARLQYKIGKKDFEMIETLVERDPPEHLRLVYEAKGVWNQVDNRFTETDDGATLWQLHTEFRCRGVMWLVSLVMPGMFRTQTETYMRQFKNFVEGGALG